MYRFRLAIVVPLTAMAFGSATCISRTIAATHYPRHSSWAWTSPNGHATVQGSCRTDCAQAPFLAGSHFMVFLCKWSLHDRKFKSFLRISD